MIAADIVTLLSRAYIDEAARPSDIRYGKAIQLRGGVRVVAHEPSRIEAWVGGLDGSVAEGGSQRRKTRFWIEASKLTWHCAGNPRNHQIFCKHCVALALELLTE
jgi:uncharacterized Zn finger protein